MALGCNILLGDQLPTVVLEGMGIWRIRSQRRD